MFSLFLKASFNLGAELLATRHGQFSFFVGSTVEPAQKPGFLNYYINARYTIQLLYNTITLTVGPLQPSTATPHPLP